MPKKLPERIRKYKARFSNHRMGAKYRGIPFLLTFEQWLGAKRGYYVMARFGDKGPYAIGNVRIIKHEENSSEKRHSAEAKKRIGLGSLGKVVSPHTRGLLALANLGKKQSKFTREKRSESLMGKKNALGYKFTPEQRANTSKARMGNKNRLGKPHSDEAKAKIRAGHARRRERLAKEKKAA